MKLRDVTIGASSAIGAVSGHYLVLVIAAALFVVPDLAYYGIAWWVAWRGLRKPESQAFTLQVLEALYRPPRAPPCCRPS